MNIEYERYYDGIPPKEVERHAKMTEDELNAEIEAEKRKCEEMKEW